MTFTNSPRAPLLPTLVPNAITSVGAINACCRIAAAQLILLWRVFVVAIGTGDENVERK